MSKKYCVIIGDIVQSKGLKNRKVLQKKFHNIFKKVNKKFSSQIVSQLIITIGDEFQVVLKDLSHSYKIIDEIQEMFYPIRLRFGVGYGRITTHLKRKAIGMDGPAFHRARTAIERSHREEKEVLFQIQAKEKELALNAIIAAISVFKQSWTARQFEAVKSYRSYHTQKKAARAMKIDRTTLAKMLKAAKWDHIAELEKATNELCGLF